MKLKMDSLISDHQNEVCEKQLQFENNKEDAKVY